MSQQLLISQLEELWKLTSEKKEKDIFIEDTLKEKRYSLIKNQLLLKEDDFDRVFYSRTFPIISTLDRKALAQKKVLFLGCSTNSPVATALLQQGLKTFVLVDPDIIDLSNTNRITGAGVQELGKNKAIHLSEYLKGIHPYITTTVYTKRLDEKELELVIKGVDLVIEMVDDPATKVTTRILAKKHNKTVLMITGIGDQPIVVVEKPGDAYFHRFHSEKDIAPFFNKELSVQERFRLYCTIIGTKNLPASMMVNMILAALGIRSYIAQHGGTAMIAGGLGAYAARELLLGRRLRKEIPVNIPHLLSFPQEVRKAENGLWKSLQNDYPKVFLKTDKTFRSALKRLARELFGISY